MNEQHIDPEPSLNLPRPRSEQGFANNEVNSEYTDESAQAAAIEMGSGTGPAPLMPPPQSKIMNDNSTSGQPDGFTLPNSQMPMPVIADDIDLIEKEWVHKAKEILAHTQGDPYVRNKEMNKVKADYLKKRYNKDLNLEDK